MTNMFVMGLEGDDITPGLVGAKLLLFLGFLGTELQTMGANSGRDLSSGRHSSNSFAIA